MAVDLEEVPLVWFAGAMFIVLLVVLGLLAYESVRLVLRGIEIYGATKIVVAAALLVSVPLVIGFSLLWLADLIDGNLEESDE